MTLRLSMPEQHLVCRASEVLLSAASFANECDWHRAVMESLMPLTGAYKAAIRVAEPRGFRMTPLVFEESAIDEHRAYYHQFDFGRALGEKPRLTAVFSRNEYYGKDLSRFRQTEYYADYIARYAVFDALCLSNNEHDHDRGAVLYLWHERELTDIRRTKGLAMLRLLAPSFKAGIAFATQFQRHRTGVAALLEQNSDGMILFDQNLITLHRNPAFGEILAGAEDHQSLMDAVARCAKAVRDAYISRGNNLATMGHVSTTTRLRNESYTITGCILQTGPDGALSILVSVTRLRTRGFDSAITSELRESFNLTQREVEVAILLRSRQTNHEIAMRLGVSDHTARHHTESVLRKLRVETRKGVAAVLSAVAQPALTEERLTGD